MTKLIYWIARDFDGSLALFYDKPQRDGAYFFGKTRSILDRRLYPEVTFGNSPQEVELVIKK